MTDNQESVRRQLDNARENLLLIEERMAEYVLEVDVPLQLVREKRRLEERIAELEGRMAGLAPGEAGGRASSPGATHVDTGGGMYVAGNVINQGVMVGRDQHVGGDLVLGDKVGGGKTGARQRERPDRGQGAGEKLRVFLCHAPEDRQAAGRLYEQLLAEGVDPWWGEEDLLPGQSWQLEVSKAVRAAHVVAVCLSRHTNQAGSFQKEIRYALDVADEQPEGAIFVIPVRLEACEVPDRLRELTWVDLYDERGYTRLMRALRARAEALGIGL